MFASTSMRRSDAQALPDRAGLSVQHEMKNDVTFDASIAVRRLFICILTKVSMICDALVHHSLVVEVPGIEPGSLGEDLVILRAQFALAFLCPDVHANKMSTGTVTVRFSVRTRDRFRW